MYVRQVEDQELNFCVSGKLWKRSLVMLDEETKSLWSHLLGKCMEGELQGTELKTIPSVIADWGSWKKQYPETDAMIWPQRSGRSFDYDVTFYDRDPEKFVIGYVSGGTAKSYAFPDLRKQPLVNDVVARQPIVIWFSENSGAAWCFDRKLDDQVLEFRRQDGTTIDEQTGSHWDLRNGVATAGKLAGKKLTPRVVIPSFAHSWNVFHPKTEKWDRD